MTIFIRSCVLFLPIHNLRTQHKYVSPNRELQCPDAYRRPTELAGSVAPRAGLDNGTFEIPTVVFFRIRVFWGVTFLWASADVSNRLVPSSSEAKYFK